jgi:potassium efflux system protein
VRALAEVNAGLTRQLPDVAADIERVTSQLDAIKDQAKNIEQRLSRSKQRLEIGGVSRSIGQLLVEERRSLPKVSQYRSQVRLRRSTLAEIGLAQVRIQEQRRELTPLDARVEDVMTDVRANVTDEQELDLIRSEVRLLLRDRRELLVQADNNYSRYLQVLGDLDVAQRRLLDSASEYQDFLGENLLWIPSAPIAFMGDWQNLGPAAAQAFSLTLWSATITSLAASVADHPEEAVFSFLLLAALLAARWPLANRYKTMSGMVGRPATDSIGLTFASLAIAVVRALPLTLLLVMLGWFLSAAPQASPFSMAVSSALFVVAPFLYNVLLFRVLSASNGVLRVHFGWSEDILQVIRRQLDRLAAIAAPLVFAIVFFFSSEVAGDRATMGRLAFVALMAVLSWTFRPLAHPVSGVAATYYTRHPDAHGSRLQRLWYVLAMGVPLLLALISILGYLYTSLILTGRLVDTIWLILSLVVVNLVVLRWLALARRKLALRIAQSEREAQQAAREKVSKADVDDEAPIAAAKPLDLDEVDQQTRKLLRAGLIFVAILGGWAIWADLFPAFSLLDKVALWSQTILVDGVETIAPVTLADVFLEKPARPHGNSGAAAPHAAARQPLCDQHPDALCRRYCWHDIGTQYHRLELVADSMAGCRAQRRSRLWTAGNCRQFRVWTDHFIRTSRAGWRYRHGWPALRYRIAGPDSRDNDHRLGPQRDHRAQQGVYYRAGRQLDALRPDYTGCDPGRYFLRFGCGARP